MEKIDSTDAEQKDNSLEKFLNTLKNKLEVPKPQEQNTEISIEDIIKKDLEDVVIEVNNEEGVSFNNFVGKLKDILTTNPVEEDKTEALPLSGEEKSVNKSDNEDVQTDDYVEELEKIKNGIAIEKQDTRVSEIKKLIEEYAEKYLKRAVGYAGESGGGSVAKQFANGGTMEGSLNVTGNYLSGGVNLLNIFGGGSVGDPAVNALVHSNSGQWNTAYTNLVSNSANYLSLSDLQSLSGNWESTYTTVSTFSATWSTGIQTLAFNTSNYNLSISNGNSVNLGSLKDDLSEISAVSGSWNNTYTTVTANSAFWSQAYTNLVSNSAVYLGIEKVKNLSDNEYSLDLNQFTIYTKSVTGENVLTYSNFVSGRTLTIYLSASHDGVVGHYFPINTYFGSNGTSNIVYTFSGFCTKAIIQNVGNYFLGTTFLIPINVQQYPKVGDFMLMEGFGFILQEDNYRIILD